MSLRATREQPRSCSRVDSTGSCGMGQRADRSRRRSSLRHGQRTCRTYGGARTRVVHTHPRRPFATWPFLQRSSQQSGGVRGFRLYERRSGVHGEVELPGGWMQAGEDRRHCWAWSSTHRTGSSGAAQVAVKLGLVGSREGSQGARCPSNGGWWFAPSKRESGSVVALASGWGWGQRASQGREQQAG